MEQTVWSDERLDERFTTIDRRFDELDRHVVLGFERVDKDVREVRSEIRDLRTLMFQLWGTTMVAILGTLATVLASNL